MPQSMFNPMSAPAGNSSMSESTEDELDLLHRKRVVLEQLLLYARQLSRLESGVEALQQMLKPSQQPGRIPAAIVELSLKLNDLDDAALQKQLLTLDASVARDLSDITTLSRLDHAAFCAKYFQATGSTSATGAIEALEARVLEFRRKTQTNVALRYLLYQRGIQLSAAKLPVTQEQVVEHLAAIRQQETQCRLKLKLQTRQMLEDVDVILNSTQYSDEFKRQFAPARAALQNNMDLLAQGCRLDELPSSVETITFDESSLAKISALGRPGMEAEVAPVPAAALPPVGVSANVVAAKEPVTSPSARGFWHKFRRWLSTPWHVRWQDME